MSNRRDRHRQIVTFIAVLVAIVGVVGAVTLFQQDQPAVPSSQMTENCSSTFATPASVTTGTDGEITFSCNSAAPATSPAFETDATVVVVATITGFGLPYADLFIYDADGAVNTGPCGSRTSASIIVSGGSETIAAGGWNYCARYSDANPDGLPTFTVVWSTE